MKIVRKILPLSTLAIVGTIPFTATSCSKVYEDLLSKPYIPKDVTPLEAAEETSEEVEKDYYEYFKDRKNLLAGDSLWGSSLFGRKMYTKDNPLSKIETYLNYVSSFDLVETESETHRFSYTFKSQIQVRNNTQESGAGSYSINTYDIYFEFKNIECYMTYYGAYEDSDSGRGADNPYQVWMICPTKYNIERGRWYQELLGNECIKFEIKAVYKGYSENGAQNYVRETSESAIVDEAHKYVPELNEIYTELMLLDPYFLCNVKPKVYMDKERNTYITPVEGEPNTYKWTTNFKFNEKTCSDQKGEKIKFSKLNEYYVYSPTGSTAQIVELSDADDSKIPSSTGESVGATYKIKFDKQPNVGDIAYFCVSVEHPATATQPKWTEWFPISGIVSN